MMMSKLVSPAVATASRTFRRGLLSASPCLRANAAVKGDVIGIDLGTTNSCVAVIQGEAPMVIENSEGMRTTPSVVAMLADGQNLVGIAAKRQAAMNPDNTLFATKRLIGRRFDDPATQKDLTTLPYSIVKGPNGDAWVKAGDKKYSPSQVGAVVVGKMKATAEEFLGRPVTQAVITCPAYFNDAQRQATKDAGKIAGLEVLRVINEPTAAALAFGIEEKEGQTLAVYDLGGGTFDISILEIFGGVFEVKATNGDTSLGGEDLDHAVQDAILAKFKASEGIDLSKDKIALGRIRECAEAVKIELSSKTKADINLPFIMMDASGPKHLVMEFTRTELESIVEPFLNRTIEPCKKCAQDAGVQMSGVDKVLLVGGSTRMPMVSAVVKKIYGKDPSKAVNPDEAVAVGAAIQAGVLAGTVSDVTLLDVTPLSLGIEMMGGVFSRIIDRNSAIPTKKTKTYVSTADNQDQFQIKVFQGEREIASHNKMLGQFTVGGFPPAPKGGAKADITFDIDASGVVKVTAADKASGKSKSVIVQSSGGLSEGEVERMIQEAEQMREADQKRVQTLDAKNASETLCYQVEKQLNDFKDKISTDQKDDLKKKMAVLRQAMDGGELEELQEKTKELQEVSWKVTQSMYEQSGSQEEKKDEK